jgi:protocatechuate 3,4-dioxygenase beta subunit
VAPAQQDDGGRLLSRRAFLAATAGLAGVALVSCGGDDDAAAEAVAETEPPATVAPTSGPGPCTELSPTPRGSEGGHYRPGAPERTTLREGDVSGTPLRLDGRVLLPDCRPVAGAVLDVWQADGTGAYDDTGTRLRGVFRTDPTGAFSIPTVRPGAHDDRAPHVHVKVAEAPGGRIVTATVFFAGDPRNDADRGFRPALAAAVRESGGETVATLDLVVENG